MAALFALVGLLAINYATAQCTSSLAWTGTVTLNAAAEYTLQYLVSGGTLTIHARAKTTGFMGFGLSEAGHMMGSDIVTMAVVNGQGRVEDRFAKWTPFDLTALTVTPTTPTIDCSQDWTTVCASEVGGYSEFILSRAVLSTDNQDRNITSGDMVVIFSWGTTDTVAYHGANRGSTLVNFYASAATTFVSPPDTDFTQEVRMNNYPLDTIRTQYALQKIILDDDVAHIVAVEPVIPDADKPFVHHMLLHDCGTDPNGGFFSIYTLPPNVPVQTPGTTISFIFSPLGAPPCTGLIFGWAKGGSPVSFPSVAGYKTGAGVSTVLVLELHLDNAAAQTGKIITSGVRLHFANTLRTNDVGTLGNPNANFNALPGLVNRTLTEGTCTTACTTSFGGPITMFLSFPHMHAFGKEIWSTVYPGSDPSVLMSYKQFWNFNFQNQFPIDITLNPGDSISTHCVYDTSLSSNSVVFGTSSLNEMCMDFISYYPKANAGLKCGWATTGTTACKDSIISETNPVADGVKSIPSEVSVGNGCYHEAADSLGTSSPTAPGSSTHASASLFHVFIIVLMTIFASLV